MTTDLPMPSAERPAMAPHDEGFDAVSFDRSHGSRRSRAHGRAEIARLACGVTGMIAWFGGEIRSALHVGAGSRLWRDWFAQHTTGVRYVSTGHERRDITRWRARERFDLVVCQRGLPYLPDADAERALGNITAMSRGFLYLEAITVRDLMEVCDREATDVHVRDGAWYRDRLAPHFIALGCGLHYRKGGPLGFYELEHALPVAGPDG